MNFGARKYQDMRSVRRNARSLADSGCRAWVLRHPAGGYIEAYTYDDDEAAPDNDDVQEFYPACRAPQVDNEALAQELLDRFETCAAEGVLHTVQCYTENPDSVEDVVRAIRRAKVNGAFL